VQTRFFLFFFFFYFFSFFFFWGGGIRMMSQVRADVVPAGLDKI